MGNDQHQNLQLWASRKICIKGRVEMDSFKNAPSNFRGLKAALQPPRGGAKGRHFITCRFAKSWESQIRNRRSIIMWFLSDLLVVNNNKEIGAISIYSNSIHLNCTQIHLNARYMRDEFLFSYHSQLRDTLDMTYVTWKKTVRGKWINALAVHAEDLKLTRWGCHFVASMKISLSKGCAHLALLKPRFC